MPVSSEKHQYIVASYSKIREQLIELLIPNVFIV